MDLLASSNKKKLAVLVAGFVMLSLPVAIYLLKTHVFDVRNRADEEDYARLFMVSSNSICSPEDTFSVDIKLDTGNSGNNEVDGVDVVLRYSSERLFVTGVDTEDVDPIDYIFDDYLDVVYEIDGVVRLSGLTSPGVPYSGESGLVATVHFEVRQDAIVDPRAMLPISFDFAPSVNPAIPNPFDCNVAENATGLDLLRTVESGYYVVRENTSCNINDDCIVDSICDTDENSVVMNTQCVADPVTGNCDVTSVDIIECANGCLNGVCVDDVECTVNSDCDDPQDNDCFDTDTVNEYPVEGVCDAGVCEYIPVPVDCAAGEVCTAGVCVDDVECTVNSDCDDPQDNDCFDTDTVNEYPVEGVCDAGVCEYIPVPVDCAAGEVCTAGVCTARSCTTEGSTECDDLESVSCNTENQLIFTNYGCSGDLVCVMELPSMVPCVYGCDEGATECNPECIDDTGCTVSPDNTCSADGVCVDCLANPDCNTASPNECDENNTGYIYPSEGTCDIAEMTCGYDDPEVTDCTIDGRECSEGVCNVQSCIQDTDCNIYPYDDCEGDDEVNYSDNGGICNLDTNLCEWTPVVTTCDFGCTGGACNQQCTVATECTDYPADRCEDDTLIDYDEEIDETVVCDNNICVYGFSETACVYGCSAGACLPECTEGNAATRCNVSSGDFCNNTVPSHYETPGSCPNGECVYVLNTDTDCADSNQVCNPETIECVECFDNAHCGDDEVCEDNVCTVRPECTDSSDCDNSPDNYCMADNTTLVEWDETADCLGGYCVYSYSTITCEYGCLSGACVELPPLTADLDGDGDVDMVDYGLFVEDYMLWRNYEELTPRSDFYTDSQINMYDYAYFVQAYLSYRYSSS